MQPFENYGGLVMPGERLDAALARLERSPEYAKRISSDEGQRLLDAVAREANDRRRGAPGRDEDDE